MMHKGGVCRQKYCFCNIGICNYTSIDDAVRSYDSEKKFEMASSPLITFGSHTKKCSFNSQQNISLPSGNIKKISFCLFWKSTNNGISVVIDDSFFLYSKSYNGRTKKCFWFYVLWNEFLKFLDK